MAAKYFLKKNCKNFVVFQTYKNELLGNYLNPVSFIPCISAHLLKHGDTLLALKVINLAVNHMELRRYVIEKHLKNLQYSLSSEFGSVAEDWTTAAEVLQLLKMHGGVQSLLALLMMPEIGARCCDEEFCHHNSTTYSVHSLILSILTEIAMLDAPYARSVTLIEHLLIMRESTIQLSTISGFEEVAQSLDGDCLAQYCSILAVVLSDLDLYENKTLYEPRYSDCTLEVHHWMRYIDTLLTDVMSNSSHAQSANVADMLRNIPEATLQNQIESLGNTTLHRVEAICVLGILLLGKQRNTVKQQLAKLQLIPHLSSLFDCFIWEYNQGTTEHVREIGHESFCECSPEVAFKIQFLRLIHSYCDQSDLRYLMLTPEEYEEVLQLQSTHKPFEEMNSKFTIAHSSNQTPPSDYNLQESQKQRYPPEHMCTGDHGLLIKIVEALQKETVYSTFRFWFSRAVECYLRSGNPFADQIFLIRRGLLEHLAYCLLSGKMQKGPKEVLQSTFDLLGELLKFNIEAFMALDELLCTRAKFNAFFRLVMTYIVDSNMFIRSLVLSNDYFMKIVEHKDYIYQSRALTQASSFTQRLNFLITLINTIKVDTLTQENVSCLNTSLIILMLARQRAYLPHYLEALRTATQNGDILVNLRDLLRFWQVHYLKNNEGQCQTLTKNSCISFEFWKDTVSTLVADNRFSPECIHHYLTTDDMHLNRTI